jgi:hypothetical protein
MRKRDLNPYITGILAGVPTPWLTVYWYTNVEALMVGSHVRCVTWTVKVNSCRKSSVHSV